MFCNEMVRRFDRDLTLNGKSREFYLGDGRVLFLKKRGLIN